MVKPSRSGGDRSHRRATTTLLIVTLLTAMGASSCVSTANDPPTGTDPSTRPAASSAPVTTVAPSVSVGPVTEPSLPDESPAPTKLRTTDTVISGRSGSVTWRIRVPKFSGAPAAAEVNKRVRAAVNGMITQTKREGRSDDGGTRRLDGEGTVVTNDGRTAQVMITYGDYLEGTAHPTDYVTTTVVDVVRRKPIVLEQVFTHPTAAYKKLKPAILRAAGEQASGIDQAGLAPKKANWANWQSNTSGMVFVFGDYQLGTHGLREYAVPWSTVDPLLTGYAKRVLAPQ